MRRSVRRIGQVQVPVGPPQTHDVALRTGPHLQSPVCDKMLQVLNEGLRVFLKATDDIIWVKTTLLFVQWSPGENLNPDLKEE